MSIFIRFNPKYHFRPLKYLKMYRCRAGNVYSTQTVRRMLLAVLQHFCFCCFFHEITKRAENVKMRFNSMEERMRLIQWWVSGRERKIGRWGDCVHVTVRAWVKNVLKVSVASYGAVAGSSTNQPTIHNKLNAGERIPVKNHLINCFHLWWSISNTSSIYELGLLFFSLMKWLFSTSKCQPLLLIQLHHWCFC